MIRTLPMLSLAQAIASANIFVTGMVVLLLIGPDEFLHFGFIGYLIAFLKCIFEGYISPSILRIDNGENCDAYYKFTSLTKALVLLQGLIFVCSLLISLYWPIPAFIFLIFIFLIAVTFVEFIRSICIATDQVNKILVLDFSLASSNIVFVAIFYMSDIITFSNVILSLIMTHIMIILILHYKDIFFLFKNKNSKPSKLVDEVSKSNIGHQYVIRLIGQVLIYTLAMMTIANADLALIRLSQILSSILRIPLMGTRQYVYSKIVRSEGLLTNELGFGSKAMIVMTMIFLAASISVMVVFIDKVILGSNVSILIVFVASFMFLLIPFMSFIENTLAALIKQRATCRVHCYSMIIFSIMIMIFPLIINYVGVLLWPFILLLGSILNAIFLHFHTTKLTR